MTTIDEEIDRLESHLAALWADEEETPDNQRARAAEAKQAALNAGASDEVATLLGEAFALSREEMVARFEALCEMLEDDFGIFASDADTFAIFYLMEHIADWLGEHACLPGMVVLSIHEAAATMNDLARNAFLLGKAYGEGHPIRG